MFQLFRRGAVKSRNSGPHLTPAELSSSKVGNILVTETVREMSLYVGLFT